MRAVVDLALDREFPLAVDAFVKPLDERLRSTQSGRVLNYREEYPLMCHIELAVKNSKSMDVVGQFLVEVDAPIGTITYERGWFGRKKNIFILGPEMMEDVQNESG